MTHTQQTKRLTTTTRVKSAQNNPVFTYHCSGTPIDNIERIYHILIQRRQRHTLNDEKKTHY